MITCDGIDRSNPWNNRLAPATVATEVVQYNSTCGDYSIGLMNPLVEMHFGATASRSRINKVLFIAWIMCESLVFEQLKNIVAQYLPLFFWRRTSMGSSSVNERDVGF